MSWLNRFFGKKGTVEKLTPGKTSLFDQISEGDICIDCGANVGIVTSKFVDKGAFVHAFEPNPFAFQVLEKKFSSNKRVICYQKGVHTSNSKKELYFHMDSDQDEVYWSTGSSFLSVKKNVNKEKSQLVEIIDLDEFIINLERQVKILKLDVEGVEVEILNKLIDTGTIHKIDEVWVETHDHKIPELKESTEKLRDRLKKEGLKHIKLNWV